MDEQNLQNEQNDQNTAPEAEVVQPANNYQDYTAAVDQPVVEAVVEQPKKNNSLAIVSLVLGIISIVLGCCGSWIAIVLGIGGIVCSVLSKKEGKTGMATAGMICSIVGIVLAIIVLTLAIIFSVALIGEMDTMSYY